MFVLVTGMHRSGTTHLGELLRRANPDYGLLHEPANRDLGDPRIKYWYPEESDYPGFLGRVANLDIRANRFVRLGSENFVRSVGRALVGGTFSKSIRHAKKRRSSGLIIKDPFLLNFVSSAKHNGIVPIVIYRHPLANLQSIRQQGWGMRIEDFHPKFQSFYYENHERYLRNFSVEDSRTLLLWAYLHGKLTGAAEKILISHQVFCQKPLETVDELISRKLITDQSGAVEFINKTMFFSQTRRKAGLHDFNRNAKDLAFSWKKQYTKQQRQMVENDLGDLLLALNNKAVVL